MAHTNDFTVLITALLSLQLVLIVSGAPTSPGRWLNPCGGSTPASGTSFVMPVTPTPPPVRTDLLTVKLMSQTAASLSDELTNTIRGRITDSVATALDSMATFSGFPNTTSPFFTGITIENLLQEEAKRLSEMGVFWEQARLDTDDYTNKIEQIENKYVEILCKMHVMLQQHNQEVTSQISRDIMGSQLRNLHQTAQKDQRNYLINRDAKKIFVSITAGVDAYLAENN